MQFEMNNNIIVSMNMVAEFSMSISVKLNLNLIFNFIALVILHLVLYIQNID